MDRQLHERRRSILGRLCGYFDNPSETRSRSSTSGESLTENFDRVLVLWLDLQHALQRSGYQPKCDGNWFFSTCTETAVQEAWQKLTHPGNALGLERLFYQMADQGRLELSRHALQACRARRDAESSPS